MNVNRVNSILVSNVESANTGTSLATIAEGDVLVLNSKTQNLVGTPTINSAEGNEAILLALGLPSKVEDADRKFRISSKILGKNITSWQKQDFEAPVEQISYIGYNGVGNALALEDSTEYRLRITLKDRHRMRPHRQSQFDFYHITGASADNYIAANSLASKVNTNNRLSKEFIIAEVIEEGGTLVELAADAIVTNGVKAVQSAGHGLAVGDFVSIRDVLFSVSKVIDTNNFELDRSYSGVSETIVVASTTDQIASVTGSTSFGIKLTALPAKPRKVDLYQQVAFAVNLSPINGVPGQEQEVTDMEAIIGNGDWKQIRDMEFFESSYRGITNKRLFPVDDFTPIAESGRTYRVYVIEHFEDTNVLAAGVLRNPISTVLAFDISVATTKADAVEAILDSYIQSAGLAAV